MLSLSWIGNSPHHGPNRGIPCQPWPTTNNQHQWLQNSMITTAMATNNSGSNEQETTKKNTPWNHWKLPRDRGKATASNLHDQKTNMAGWNLLRVPDLLRLTGIWWKQQPNNKKPLRNARTTTKISGGWSETTTDLPLITTKTDANHQDLPSWVAGQIRFQVKPMPLGWIRDTNDNNSSHQQRQWDNHQQRQRDNHQQQQKLSRTTNNSIHQEQPTTTKNNYQQQPPTTTQT